MEVAGEPRRMMPLVVVQVVAYWSPEGKQDLQDLFASLERVDYPRDRWRIVVVDNPSPHGTAAPYLQERWMSKAGETLPEITLIASSVNDGFSGGHERGFELASQWQPDYLYLINQDASVDPQFLWRIVQAAESQPRAAIIQSRIMLKQEPGLLNTRGNALHFLGYGFALGYKQVPEMSSPPESHLEKGGSASMFYASGAGMLLRMSVLKAVGGLFDPVYFMYHEDTDLSWRARLAGYDIGYDEHSVIYHRYEFSRSIKKFYWMERNRLLMILSNYQLGTVLMLLPALTIMEMGGLYFAIKSGWGKTKMQAWLYFLRPTTWMFLRARRAMVKNLRQHSDRQMLERMVGVITSQEINNHLLTRLVNPCLRIYFALLKSLTRW